MSTEELLNEVRDDVKALHKKLDTALTQTTKNTTDISWLKKSHFGTMFAYVLALAYTKFFK